MNKKKEKRKMLKQLTELFTLWDVEFEWVSPTEILVPCPLDLLPFGDNPKKPQIEIINDPRVGVQDDEAYVLIEECDNHLNWLVVSATEDVNQG